jgi:hypothetical protein
MENEMPAYRLNLASGQIRYNRRAVGSVVRATNGRWVGSIGQHTVDAADMRTAFREVAARAMGFPNAGTLRLHNAQIRRSNTQRRAAVRSAWRNEPPRPAARPTPEMIEGIRQGAIAVGETPLTVEQILASWRNG